VADGGNISDMSQLDVYYCYKILIVGNSGAGKSAFLTRYTDDSFVSAFVPTVGIEFKAKTLSRWAI